MKVWIDRDTCDVVLPTCLSCFGQLVMSGVPDRACIMDYEDDGSEDMTVYMHSGEHDVTITIPKDMREMVAFDGWDKYVSWEPAFSRSGG